MSRSMSKTSKIALTGLVYGLVAASMAAPGFASDTKYFAGSECMGIDGTTVFRYNSNSEVFNSNTSYDRDLSCPLIHDETGLDDYWVQISVWDGNPTIAVECTAYANNWGGPSVVGWGSDASVGTGRDTLLMYVYSTDPSAYHHVICSVPRYGSSGYSHVTSLYYHEF